MWVPKNGIPDLGGLEVVEMSSARTWGGMGIFLVICCFGMEAQGKYGGGTGHGQLL